MQQKIERLLHKKTINRAYYKPAYGLNIYKAIANDITVFTFLKYD